MDDSHIPVHRSSNSEMSKADLKSLSAHQPVQDLPVALPASLSLGRVGFLPLFKGVFGIC